MEQHDASASLPAPTLNSESSPSRQVSLSASEPTLRFPRPLGNRRLASWLSSSNPDIMRLTTTTEDTGLSESTYELVSGPNTDTDSQDGNYTESMSESFSSLDFHRPDDTYSIAETELPIDEEFIVEEPETYRPATPHHDDDDDDEDDYDEEEEEDDEDDDDRDEDTNDEMDEDTVLAGSQATNRADVESLSESEHQARSLSSLEYTQQSLKTPSLPPSPEASRLVERVQELLRQPVPEKHQSTWSQRMAKIWEIKTRVEDYVTEAASAALPGFIFVVAIALVIPVFYNPAALNASSPLCTTANGSASTSVAAAITTSDTTTTTVAAAAATTTNTTTHITSDMRPSPTSTGGVGLIPVGEATSDEWRFGAKKPVISFTIHERDDVFIHIPPRIKKTWLAKECLTVTAKRVDGLPVDNTMTLVDEGILIKFARNEVHGVISLLLEATCRPKVNKVVKVHFTKGLMSDALKRTLSLIGRDLPGFVPAAAQEAERHIEGAKRSLESVCQNVCQNLQSASETVSKTFGTNFGTQLSDTRQSLENIASDALARIKGATEDITNKIDTAARQATEQLPMVQDVQSQLQLQLLDAQISAKLWWLRATGQEEEGREYRHKARTFMAQKHAAANEASQERRKGHEKLTEPASRLWWSTLMGKSRCQSSAGGKGESGLEC